MKSFMLSFATIGKQFGAVFTDANDPKAALLKVTGLGLNAGGECAIFQIPSAEADQMGRDKFFNAEEMTKAGYGVTKTLSREKRREYLSHASRVCEDCNNRLAYNAPQG